MEGVAVVLAGQRPLRVPRLIASRTRIRALLGGLLAGWKGGRLDPKAKITEYQCVPEGELPRR